MTANKDEFKLAEHSEWLDESSLRKDVAWENDCTVVDSACTWIYIEDGELILYAGDTCFCSTANALAVIRYAGLDPDYERLKALESAASALVRQLGDVQCIAIADVAEALAAIKKVLVTERELKAVTTATSETEERAHV